MMPKKHKRKFSTVDLFSGCGGFSKGLEEAGFEIILGIDNDEAALRTFKHNHPLSETFCGDISKLNRKAVEELVVGRNPDLIVGGPPCQGMSLSGPRNLEDPRNTLYLSFIRIVRDLRPRAFIIENVPGLLSLFKGQIITAILREFEALDYHVTYKILRASDFGVPQHRKRVFIVGTLDDPFDFPAPTHFERNSLFENVNRMISTEEALSDLPLLQDTVGELVQDYPTAAQNEYQKYCRRNSSSIYNHIAANHSDRIKEIISHVPPGKNYKSLPSKFQGIRNFNVAWTRFPDKIPAPTIDTGHRHHFHYKANRVPTVRECARLQSFTDDFHFFGNKSQQFRQVGNAVPPLLARAIGKHLENHIS